MMMMVRIVCVSCQSFSDDVNTFAPSGINQSATGIRILQQVATDKLRVCAGAFADQRDRHNTANDVAQPHHGLIRLFMLRPCISRRLA